MQVDADARARAMDQWNNLACGQDGDADGTLEYFIRVEDERYRQQYWQRQYFDFSAFDGKKILEIGVGQGIDLVQFAKSGAECHAVDITENHIALAERNFHVRELTAIIRRADATDLPYPDGYFDCVYSFGVIHHIPESRTVLDEIYRVLKPGGTVMVGLYHKWSAHHLFALLFRNGILKGKLFRLGYDGLLSLIERGADGVRFKPYVRLYSRGDMRALLQKFEIEDVSIHQLYAEHVLPFRFVASMQKRLPLENLFGWYVTAKAIKPSV